MSDQTLVICPNCVHQFRAIPQDVQAELERLQSENERLQAVIAGDATLAGMHFETGSMHMGLKSPLVPVMADALAKMVDGSNYVEMTFKHQQTGDEYLLHCQRLSRPTPHQLRQRAEAERDQALEALTDMRRWLDNNTTHYLTAESEGPVLAAVSKKIWYHATDDTESYPFTAVIDRLLSLPNTVPLREVVAEFEADPEVAEHLKAARLLSEKQT